MRLTDARLGPVFLTHFQAALRGLQTLQEVFLVVDLVNPCC